MLTHLRPLLLCAIGMIWAVHSKATAHAEAQDVLAPWPLGTDTATGGCEPTSSPLPSRFPNVLLHGNDTVAQNEVSIAIDPTNTTNLLVGLNAIWDTVYPSGTYELANQGTCRSSDAGLSWTGSDDSPLAN